MTTHELARRLLKMDDVDVTVAGYECGQIIVTTIHQPRWLKKDVHTKDYYGPHEYASEHEASIAQAKTRSYGVELS